jgi:hypothetical protein
MRAWPAHACTVHRRMIARMLEYLLCTSGWMQGVHGGEAESCPKVRRRRCLAESLRQSPAGHSCHDQINFRQVRRPCTLGIRHPPSPSALHRRLLTVHRAACTSRRTGNVVLRHAARPSGSYATCRAGPRRYRMVEEGELLEAAKPVCAATTALSIRSVCVAAQHARAR